MDIPQTINELQAAGLTQAQIANEIGCSQSTVSDLAAGKAGTVRPSYKIVKGLEDLIAKHCKRVRSKSKAA